MIKKYFQKFTLFTLLAFIFLTAFIIIAISRQPEELKTGWLYNIALALLVVLAIDVLLKLILKMKTAWLWILQVLLLLLAIYIWIISE